MKLSKVVVGGREGEGSLLWGIIITLPVSAAQPGLTFHLENTLTRPHWLSDSLLPPETSIGKHRDDRSAAQRSLEAEGETNGWPYCSSISRLIEPALTLSVIWPLPPSHPPSPPLPPLLNNHKLRQNLSTQPAGSSIYLNISHQLNTGIDRICKKVIDFDQR